MSVNDRYSFRADKVILEPISRVSKRDFGGNLSKMFNTILRERFERDGDLSVTEDQPDIFELVREAMSRGISVAEVLSSEIEKQNQEGEAA